MNELTDQSLVFLYSQSRTPPFHCQGIEVGIMNCNFGPMPPWKGRATALDGAVYDVLAEDPGLIVSNAPVGNADIALNGARNAKEFILSNALPQEHLPAFVTSARQVAPSVMVLKLKLLIGTINAFPDLEVLRKSFDELSLALEVASRRLGLPVPKALEIPDSPCNDLIASARSGRLRVEWFPVEVQQRENVVRGALRFDGVDGDGLVASTVVWSEPLNTLGSGTILTRTTASIEMGTETKRTKEIATIVSSR